VMPELTMHPGCALRYTKPYHGIGLFTVSVVVEVSF
jgi:hypothetical protein